MEIKEFYDGLGQDYEIVLKRMMGNEGFLCTLLNKFVADRTIEELETALHSCDAESIFDYAHTLKGVAENLGLKPLYESISNLVELTRNGSVEGADEAFAQVKEVYDEIMDLLKSVMPRQ